MQLKMETGKTFMVYKKEKKLLLNFYLKRKYSFHIYFHARWVTVASVGNSIFVVVCVWRLSSAD